MDNGEVVAGRSVESGQPGSMIGGLIVGAALLAVLLLLGSSSTRAIVATVVATALYAVFWGVGMGFFLRRQWRQLPVPPQAQLVCRPLLPAAARGIMEAAVIGAAAVAAGAVMVVLLGDTEDIVDSAALLSVVPGALFGLSIAMAIGAVELRRWQDRHGVRLHVRIDGPRFAWTRAQARQRLVGVPTENGPR